MAALSGKAGLFDYGGKVVNINAWTMDIDTNLHEVTAWTTGVDQWRAYTPGLNGAAGTVSGFFDEASTGQDDMRANVLVPAISTARFEIDKTGGAKYTGNIYLERQSVDVDIDTESGISFDFRFSGAVAFTTTT